MEIIGWRRNSLWMEAEAVLFDLSHSVYLTSCPISRLDSSTSASTRPSSARPWKHDRAQKPPSIQPLFEVFSPRIDSTEFPSSPFLRLQEEEVPFESRKSIGGRHGWIIAEKRMPRLIFSVYRSGVIKWNKDEMYQFI